MKGRSMIEYIPLNLSAEERAPGITHWFAELLRVAGQEPKLLEPEGWFREGHGEGTFLWSPPPAACEVVVEQLGKARHKRPHCMHLVIVPRLMTGRWRRSLTR